MYSLLLILIIIFIPIPIMVKMMLTGHSAYRGVFQGTVTAVTGVTMLLLLVWAISGISLLEAMNQALNTISVENMTMTKSYEAFGLKNMDPDQLQDAFDQMKNVMKMAVPGALIVMISVLTYLNYGVLSMILRRFSGRVSVLPPFRNFTLPKSIILGSIMIYGLSYLVVKMGIINGDLMMLTVQIVFTFIFSAQGLAALFYIGYKRRAPKIIMLIIAVIFVFTWFGQTFLFLLGLLDIVLDIRKRFSQTSLK